MSQFEAIGTKWSIVAETHMSKSSWNDLMTTIHGHIDAFDKAYSRFRNDSLVTTWSRRAGNYQLPDDGYGLLHVYETLYHATDGLVTPLIGQVLSDAGYDADYSLQNKPLTTPPAWDEVIEYDKTHINLKRPALLDFGAAGKGYLVDHIDHILHRTGVETYTIDASGDILHRNILGSPVVIGLENPKNPSEVIGTVQVTNRSLCASSGSRRTWGDYHHIINPKSLQSPRDVIATWVIADTTVVADGLATALFFSTPETLMQHFQFSYASLHNDMSIQYSRDFPAEFYEEEKR